MRSFFLQVFVSFWAVTLVIFVAANVFAPRNDPGTVEQLRTALKDSISALGEPVLEDYRVHGCSAFSKLPSNISLADQDGRPLCSAALGSTEAAQLRASIRNHRSSFVTRDHRMTQVTPFTTANGQKFYFIQRLPEVPRPWWPHSPPEALPISILVTFGIAYLLTRPVRALSKAFRRFTAGDLQTRLPVSPSVLGDVGGADVRTLMIDFNSMADRINDLLDAQKILLRDVSHELRSPLARLQVAIEIAREDPSSSQELFDEALSEVARLNALIGEILTLSLLESLQQAPSETFLLDDVFDTLLPPLKFEAEANGVSLLYSPSPARMLLQGQKEMLRRALENVIRNAIRYSPSEEFISIVVSTIETSLSASQSIVPRNIACEVLIEDHGPGVPEEALTEIFQPFFRVDAARETTPGGFGVGLAIARRSIILHQGTINAENVRGGGLRIRMVLPALENGTEPRNSST